MRTRNLELGARYNRRLFVYTIAHPILAFRFINVNALQTLFQKNLAVYVGTAQISMSSALRRFL